ncbi:hypothetical protein L7F22_013973 [Adiantum nelumboides]|nr:hypothetical protein [Adiantum nelumboides]
MYQRCGSMHCAQEHVFKYMFERDLVTWTSMIGGYTNLGQCKFALDLFDLMQQEGLAADKITYSCILSACAGGTALLKGKILHACITGTLLDHDITVGNALLNMYGKCGNMKEAQVCFSLMSTVDKVSWSSMIANYAQHGRSQDALRVFNEMLSGKVLPDEVTFVSVFYACSHAGRVAEGCHWFEFMKKDLAIKPTLDHYNCMIDLLGRAGLSNQAEDMVRNMLVEPNVVSWLTLLGVCRFHADVERGEHFAEQAFELNPSDPVPYVMLSNIYFAAGKEEQAARIIIQMREKGLGQGDPCNFIEVHVKG